MPPFSYKPQEDAEPDALPPAFDLFLTITFKDCIALNKLSSITQFKQTHRKIAHIIKMCGDFQCWPEFRLDGSIHYHAIINVQNKVAYFKFVLPKLKLIGYYKALPIRTTKDLFRILEYCMKDESVNEQLLTTELPMNPRNTKWYDTDEEMTKLIKASRDLESQQYWESKMINSYYKDMKWRSEIKLYDNLVDYDKKCDCEDCNKK